MARVLSDQQKNFVCEYIKTPEHPVEAVKRAGYSKGSYERVAQRLLKNPRIQEKINDLQQRENAMKQFGYEETISSLVEKATANIDDYLSWDQNGIVIKDSKSLTRAQKANIAKVTQTISANGTVSVKIELHDQMAAIDRLARVYGMYKDKMELDIGKELHALSDEELDRKIAQAFTELLKEDDNLRQVAIATISNSLGGAN